MKNCPVQKPKIKKYKKTDGYTAWLVDGRYIRDCINEEFTNFGWTNYFSFIPDTEFWIDIEAKTGESRYYFDNFLKMKELMGKGLSYEEAVVKSDRVEKRERSKTEFYKTHKNFTKSHQEICVHKRILFSLGNKLKIWLINGEEVRTLFFIDFTEGGHGKVYDFIPANEVWIDDDLTIEERKFILVHELHERRLMAKGLDYNTAHYKSSALERFCRKTKIFTPVILFFEKIANFVFVA